METVSLVSIKRRVVAWQSGNPTLSSLHIYIYIYIHLEREGEREREGRLLLYREDGLSLVYIERTETPFYTEECHSLL